MQSLMRSVRAAARAITVSHRGARWLVACILALTASVTAHSAAGDTVTTALPQVAPTEFNGDLSKLPSLPAGVGPSTERRYRPLLRPPVVPKVELPGSAEAQAAKVIDGPKVAMPATTQNFEGIDRTDACTGGQCGAGTPPDTNGEVGPNHYIQAVNSAYGIFNKTGTRLAAFTENQLWAGDSSICNGQSEGDPVVLYDALADRWILTHFAFGFSGANTVAPYFQCIAASKTADPVAGGWWRYAVRVDDAAHPWLDDYGKFGIWTDCLYMSANEFTGAGAFAGTLFASFSRADMYAGLTLTSSIGFIANTSDPFSMVPSHLGGQSGGSVPAGTPNYFVSESQTAFAFEVRKFTAGANCGAGGTLGAATNVSQTTYTFGAGAIAQQPGTTNTLDVIDDRVMQKVQYRKLGAQESLWVAHTFRTSATGVTGIQWAQINVTGGTISTTPLQQQKYSPDSVLYRWIPSLAVDGQGNMALGYSTSGATGTNFPSIAYSGRLVGDAANTLPQTETFLIAGSGSQTGSCGGACDRWGDYSAMSADPVDDCTFWLTNQYFSSVANGANSPPLWNTRIGAFKFPTCTANNRTADLTISKTDGSLTATPGAPISYTLVVTNNGPFAVTGATVTDTLPATITGVTWTCVASAGNACPASGSGNISTSAVNLMKSGTATFTVSGTVSPSASGSLSNTASVAVPAGFTDPVPGNNSATDTDTVGAALTPPTIAKAFGTSPIVVGQPSILTITVTNPNAGTALSGVTFTDALPSGITAANSSGSGCGGTAAVNANVITLTGGTLAAGGNCSIVVTVNGAQAQAAAWTNTIASVTSTETGTNSTPATANITVSKAATSTAIVSDSANPSVVGQPYTVTYAVTVSAPGAGTPTGTVTVSDGSGSCVGTLPATSCVLTSVAVGAKSLSATYNGSANFLSSVSATAAHLVNKAATATVIVSDSPDPTVPGQGYTVSYSVSVTAPGAGTPSGTVTVSDGTATCIGTLPATSCLLTSTTLGAKSLTATYNGDGNFTASLSAAAAHQVNKPDTTTAIASDTPDPSVVGQPYTVTYSVSVTAPGTGTPGGTVTVSDGSASCSGILPATSCALTSTASGAKPLTATYNGDASFNGSVSATAAHLVNKAATSTVIVSGTPDPTVTGQAYTVTYSVTVTAPGVGAPSGSVTVSDGIDSCSGTLPATSCAVTSTTAGGKALIATYNGDGNFASSVSATTAHQVNKAATVTLVVSDNPHPSVVATAVAVSATVAAAAGGSGTPTGSIAISDGIDGCSITLPSLSCNWTPTTIGTRTLVATYGGDANFASSVSIAKTHDVVAVSQQSTVAVTLAGSGGGQVVSDDSVINCGATCAHTYANGTQLVLTATANAGSVFTGWLGACTGTGLCSLNISTSTSVSATFAPSSIGTRILDVDKNGSYEPQFDGLMAARHLFGLTGTAVTNGALGVSPQRFDPVVVGTYQTDVLPLLDIDGNGHADALTDGLLIIRYLLGLRGAALTQGAIGFGATRTTSLQLEAYLLSLTP